MGSTVPEQLSTGGIYYNVSQVVIFCALLLMYFWDDEISELVCLLP